MTKNKSNERPVRVGLISLGCAKNLVDAEIMLGSLLRQGVEITNDAAQADALIINTCSFIDSAQEESVDTILESGEVRTAQNRGQSLIVSGCLPQRFREELPKLLPEVDAFMGIDQVAQVGDIVRQAMARRAERLAGAKPAAGDKAKVVRRLNALEKKNPPTAHDEAAAIRGTEQFGRTKTVVTAPAEPVMAIAARPVFIPDFDTPRFRLTPKHFAYLKIAEGCNHPCSFCIIPRMRGSHRSRTQADIVAEAKALIADGVKEINLISQDSTYYGLDLRPQHSRAISSPEKFTAAARRPAGKCHDHLLAAARPERAPGGFLDPPVIYSSGALDGRAHPHHRRMPQGGALCGHAAPAHPGEHAGTHAPRDLATVYRGPGKKNPRGGAGHRPADDVHRRFPGRNRGGLSTLLEFIRETKFERLGVFAYSKEDGTRAGAMAGQLSDKVKQKRRELAMAAQHKVAVSVAESFMGRELKVLVEGKADARQLQAARVSSWEHGLIREAECPPAATQGPISRRARRGGRAGH